MAFTTFTTTTQQTQFNQFLPVVNEAEKEKSTQTPSTQNDSPRSLEWVLEDFGRFGEIFITK